MKNENVGRRFPNDVPKLDGMPWNAIAGALERYLRRLKDGVSGIPGGFKESDPTEIQAGDTADPGTESASWAAADHTHAVSTDTPEDLTATGADSAEGSSTSLARADHVHDTTDLLAMIWML